MAAPSTIEEGRLEDDVGTAPHRIKGQRLRGAKLIGGAQVTGRDLDHAQAVPSERIEVVGFVQVALLLDQGDRRVVLADRLVPEALDTPEFEGREMITGEVADEVSGADDECSVVGELHALNRSSGSCQLACRGRATIEP